MENIFEKSVCHSLIIVILFLNLAIGCKKGVDTPVIDTGTVTDIENNVYKTVKIGDQWWMAENLKVTKYRNGQSIEKVANYDVATWYNLLSGAYCIYDDNVNAPGKLYNWYAINDTSNIAPKGWHIPSDEEWKTLEKHLGMGQAEVNKTNFRGTNEGEKLKDKGTVNWREYSNIWATNESGFSALGGNCRMFNGEWGTPTGTGYTGFWWSSTENSGNENEAWYRHLDYKKANVFRFYGPKTYGFSIRCVKDQ